MSKIFKGRIETILNSNPDLEGFTEKIIWELKRYVVAVTHNKANVGVDKLTQQASNLYLAHNNVNLWGWQDLETNKIYLDISTSFKNLDDALKLAKEYNQIAIFDLHTFEEIRVK